MARTEVYGYWIECDEPGCKTPMLRDEFWPRMPSDDEQIAYANRQGWTYAFIDGHEHFRCDNHSSAPTDDERTGR